MKRTLTQLEFDNTYARLGDAFSTRVLPTPAPAPYWVAINPDAAALLELDPTTLRDDPTALEVFSGGALLPGFDPVAMVYAGHQFGVPVPRLGDGRAILLGEAQTQSGTRWDLHLKGSGQTPYSRFGDGRAVLRSSIREYLCGEALAGLGIPTTRTLCIVGSDEPVQRETVETRALITRLAPSHVRFGSFEYFQDERIESQKILLEYVIREFYPTLQGRYAEWFQEVCVRTARLIAQWQAVGFSHGVMNTDNFSILGITLDYGPFGFMEAFDPDFICNHSDERGRYAFSRQPAVGLWNLQVLGGALRGVIPEDELRLGLRAYEPAFHQTYDGLLREKLGIFEKEPGAEHDDALISEFFDLLTRTRLDYTRLFRSLSHWVHPTPGVSALETPTDEWKEWTTRYQERWSLSDTLSVEARAQKQARMNQANPKYVLRNYLAQKAIDEAINARNFSEIERLRVLLKNPFSEQPTFNDYAARPPAWARNLAVSCSS